MNTETKLPGNNLKYLFQARCSILTISSPTYIQIVFAAVVQVATSHSVSLTSVRPETGIIHNLSQEPPAGERPTFKRYRWTKLNTKFHEYRHARNLALEQLVANLNWKVHVIVY